MSESNSNGDEVYCLGCGYCLRGLTTQVCPECGRGFDPLDARTFRHRRSAVPFWVHWAAPPPLWLIMPTVVLTPFLLETATRPLRAPSGLFILLFCASWPFFVFVLPLDYVFRLYGVHALRKPSSSGRWRWSVTPLCLSLLLICYISDWPVRLRYHFSEAAFARTAQLCFAGQCPSAPLWIGLYRVHDIGRDGTAVTFTTGTSLSDPVGFECAFRPDSTLSCTEQEW